ncbi:Hypothetical_protein [Hexamita inflata]|uniref:Hypothetical_protein n=1 Tax=Hexamita inflata TaxID=28002 RepID=A0ABP1HMR6_9EUKA
MIFEFLCLIHSGIYLFSCLTHIFQRKIWFSLTSGSLSTYNDDKLQRVCRCTCYELTRQFSVTRVEMGISDAECGLLTQYTIQEVRTKQMGSYYVTIASLIFYLLF